MIVEGVVERDMSEEWYDKYMVVEGVSKLCTNQFEELGRKIYGWETKVRRANKQAQGIIERLKNELEKKDEESGKKERELSKEIGELRGSIEGKNREIERLRGLVENMLGVVQGKDKELEEMKEYVKKGG